MNEVKPNTTSPKLLVAVGVIIVVGALRVAQDIFIPLAIATLLSFLLAPLVYRFTRWGFPNVLAILGTVAIAFSIIGIVGWLVSAQFINLVGDLPKYQENLRAKISTLTKPREGVFSRAKQTLGILKRDIEEQRIATEKAEEPDKPKPLLVTIEQPVASPFQILQQFTSPLLGPLGTAAICLVFVVFMLLQRHDLRDRLIKLISGGNLNIATQAVDDATHKITKYLLMQMIINITYGIPIGVGLFFIGVPNALLWGLLANAPWFIPFIGPWIAAIFPLSIAIAVDPGWTMALMTLGLIVVIELISNNVIEPWLYGSSTGISAVALLFAALVWTWIWGPVGLFLSTPLTVCLLVIGKNVPSLGFLNVILGTEPVLAPEAQLYQRMLAMDSETTLELMDKEVAASSPTTFYDRVLIPALVLAERDRHAGTLAEHRQRFIFQNSRDLIDELESRSVNKNATGEPYAVVCIPAKDEADKLAAEMFAQVLRGAGISCQSTEIPCSLKQTNDLIRQWAPQVICLCAIPPGAVADIRKLCRQLRGPEIDTKIIAGIFGTMESATTVEKRLATNCPDLVATSFADALVQIRNLVFRARSEPMMPAPIPPNESERLREVESLGLLDTPPDEMFDAVTQKLASLFEVPISLVTIVDADRQFWKSQVGLPPDLAKDRQSSRSTSLCGHVVAQNELLVVGNLEEDPRFANNPFVTDRGIRFYAGAPLRTSSGHAVGSLCVIDTKPRKITGEQKWLLQILADKLMASISSANQKTREKPSPPD